MVPASTLMYGSIFCSVTRKPRASSSAPIEAAARPLPRDETTPPVTKMYFEANSSSFRGPLSDVLFFHGTAFLGFLGTRAPATRQEAPGRPAARPAGARAAPPPGARGGVPSGPPAKPSRVKSEPPSEREAASASAA